MKVKLLEPLGVADELIAELGARITDAGHEFEYFNKKTTDVDELTRRGEGADILVIANNPLPNQVIDKLDNLRYISVAFAGIDHVGDSAARKNIEIKNTAGYSDDAVAELAVGLALNLLRNVDAGDRATRAGGTIEGLIGNELNGKTVGIIGTGRIGMRTAEIYKAFRCNLLGYNRSEKQEAIDLGIKYGSLEEVLANSDIVSLHIPLNQSTKGIISKEMLSHMREDAILINVARGGVVDNEALAEALNQGKIRGAGIDVFDMEPPIPEDYCLLNTCNTLLTPHVAYATEESIIRRANMAFNNVYGWLDL